MIQNPLIPNILEKIQATFTMILKFPTVKLRHLSRGKAMATAEATESPGFLGSIFCGLNFQFGIGIHEQYLVYLV